MRRCVSTLFLLAVFVLSINAQCIDLLNFEGIENGQNPSGSLISDGTFLYGMTQLGGTNSKGTIFKIMPDGSGYLKLRDFTGSPDDGSNPLGSLIYDGTYLYGMTKLGGGSDQGTVFKIKPDGSGFLKLINFYDVPNGQFPMGSLILDGTYLYGMTNIGGAYYKGTIFKLTTDGPGFQRIYDFSGPPNGQLPSGSLISDGTFLYGLTTGGGTHNMGIIFKIKPDGSGYVKLFDFDGTANGQSPTGSLLYDNTFMYGMTQSGGANNKGTVFKIKPDGSGFEKLLDFDGISNGSDPLGSLIYDGTFLYGMTNGGGTHDRGTIFKIKSDGTSYTKLWDFAGSPNDGRNPYLSSLFSDGTYLYGLTFSGGSNDFGEMFRFYINVGMEELNKNIGITIYPDPVKDLLTIETNVFNKDAMISIYDIQGKLQMQYPVTGKKMELNINRLAKGLYFLKLKGNDNIITKKIVKE